MTLGLEQINPTNQWHSIKSIKWNLCRVSHNSKTSSTLTEKDVAVSLFSLSQTLLEDVRLWTQHTAASPDNDTQLWVRVFTSSPLKAESLRVITFVTLRTTLYEAGGHYRGRCDFLLWLTASSKMTVNSLFHLLFSSWEIVSRGEDKRMSYWAAREDLSPPRLFYWHHVMTSVNVLTSRTFIFIKGISFWFCRGFMLLWYREVLHFFFYLGAFLFNVQRRYLHTSSQTRECVHKHTWHVSSHYTALVCLTWCSCLHDNTCMQTHST